LLVIGQVSVALLVLVLLLVLLLLLLLSVLHALINRPILVTGTPPVSLSSPPE